MKCFKRQVLDEQGNLHPYMPDIKKTLSTRLEVEHILDNCSEGQIDEIMQIIEREKGVEIIGQDDSEYALFLLGPNHIKRQST